MNREAHWDHVYTSRAPEEMSWFQREPRLSLDLIEACTPSRSARILDVGGGASTLVDALLTEGYRNVCVLDVSGAALATTRRRLGPMASGVTLIVADILSAALPEHTFDLWHDRAVFHFLTDADDRKQYVSQLRAALKTGGHVVIATFAHDGPSRCSGLPVERYTAESLQRELGEGFHQLRSVREEHTTPTGTTQAFIYAVFSVSEQGRRAGAIRPQRLQRRTTRRA